ncbi:hypothetical protein [Vogesella urethralis]|uniref:hypothetical protein n=1 Tax=Vogesella urethralis TaxID=2592656 RepID=UPI00118554ED|nr:hypothetical protein [Vogesella urethralis]MEC5206682.1 hypothetical protein [Vogesella perlucida]
MTSLMKLLIATALTVSVVTVRANEAHHADTSAPSAVLKSAPAASKARTNKTMDAQMKKMQAAHDRMLAAKTPEERQAAMQVAMQTMKDGMAMMKKMRMDGCQQRGRTTGSRADGMGMHGDGQMMDMMMKMMDQQSSMMSMPMAQ